MSDDPTTPSRHEPASPSSAWRTLTIVGVLFTVALLVISTFLWLGITSHNQQSAEAKEEAQSLRSQAKDVHTEIATVRTQITEAAHKKEAQAWCDGLTSADSKLDTVRRKANSLKSMPQARKDAVAELCPMKKDFAEALDKDYNSSILTGDVDCTITGNTLSITGYAELSAPTLTNLGSFDATLEIYVTPGEVTSSDKPIDTVSVTIPSGGRGSYSTSASAPSFGGGRCTIRPAGLWPSGV